MNTALTGAIQSYNLEDGTGCDLAQPHPSAPTVLAVDHDGTLMLSASEQPPILYLQLLNDNSRAIRLSPRASSAAVSVAAFHPHHSNLFAIGFRDGTLVAYNATRLLESSLGLVDGSTRPEGVSEMAHFRHLHRATMQGQVDPE